MFYGQSRHCEDYTRQTYCFMVEAIIVKITRGRHILFYGQSHHRGDYKRQTHIVLWSKPSSWRLQEADTYCFMNKAVVVEITGGSTLCFNAGHYHGAVVVASWLLNVPATC